MRGLGSFLLLGAAALCSCSVASETRNKDIFEDGNKGLASNETGNSSSIFKCNETSDCQLAEKAFLKLSECSPKGNFTCKAICFKSACKKVKIGTTDEEPGARDLKGSLGMRSSLNVKRCQTSEDCKLRTRPKDPDCNKAVFRCPKVCIKSRCKALKVKVGCRSKDDCPQDYACLKNSCRPSKTLEQLRSVQSRKKHKILPRNGTRQPKGSKKEEKKASKKAKKASKKARKANMEEKKANNKEEKVDRREKKANKKEKKADRKQKKVDKKEKKANRKEIRRPVEVDK